MKSAKRYRYFLMVPSGEIWQSAEDSEDLREITRAKEEYLNSHPEQGCYIMRRCEK